MDAAVLAFVGTFAKQGLYLLQLRAMHSLHKNAKETAVCGSGRQAATNSSSPSRAATPELTCYLESPFVLVSPYPVDLEVRCELHIRQQGPIALVPSYSLRLTNHVF